MKQLDIIQTTALRIATGAFKSSPIISLHVEANLIPLEYWRDLRTLTWYAKIHNSSQDNQLFQLLSQDFHKLHSYNWSSNRQVPAVIRSCYILSSLHHPWGCFTPLAVCSPVPPWFPWKDILRINFPVDSKNSNSLIIQTVFNELCTNDYEGFTQIYTDGSLNTSPFSCTAAMHIPDLEYSASWRLTNARSIITGELYAILMALQFCVSYLNNNNIVIFTDSKVALFLIRNYDMSYRILVDSVVFNIKWLLDKGININIQWIPSHKGIPGNEAADTIARSAHDTAIMVQNPRPVQEELITYQKSVWDKWRTDRRTVLSLSKLGPLREDNSLSSLKTSLRSRKLTTAILRLRIGHCSLRAHLYRLRLSDSPYCNCGAEETIEHVLFYCPRYYSHITRLRHALFILGVPYELKRILGTDTEDPAVKTKIYRHLAVFLKSTGLLQRI